MWRGALASWGPFRGPRGAGPAVFAGIFLSSAEDPNHSPQLRRLPVNAVGCTGRSAIARAVGSLRPYER